MCTVSNCSVNHIKNLAGYHSLCNMCVDFNFVLTQSESDNCKLLFHPLVTSLLKRKWDSFGNKLFFTNFFIYTIFLFSLTGFGLSALSPLVQTGEGRTWHVQWCDIITVNSNCRGGIKAIVFSRHFNVNRETSSCCKLNSGRPAWAGNALLLSYDNWTTSSLHNPLYVIHG